MKKIILMGLLALMTFVSGQSYSNDGIKDGDGEAKATNDDPFKDHEPWWNLDKPTYNSVLIEKIVNLKTLGDELYRLNTDAQDEAREYYQMASEEIRKIDITDFGHVDEKIFDLLIAELAYRNFIAQNSLDFYSGVSARMPQTPSYRLKRFESRVTKFDQVFKEIDWSFDEINDQTIKASETIASMAGYAGVINETEEEAEINNLQNIKAQNYINRSYAEINRIRARREEMGNESDQLKVELDNTAEQASQIATSLATSALGVPEAELLNGNQTLEDRLKSYAVSKAGDMLKNSESIQSLKKEYADVINEVNDIKEKADEITGYVETVKDAKELIEKPTPEALINFGAKLNSEYGDEDNQQYFTMASKIQKVIKDPSIENLMAQSDLIWEQINDDDKEMFMEHIDKVKPVENLIKIGVRAAKSDNVKQEIFEEIMRNIPAKGQDTLVYKLISDYQNNKLDTDFIEQAYKKNFEAFRNNFKNEKEKLRNKIINTSFKTASFQWNKFLKESSCALRKKGNTNGCSDITDLIEDYCDLMLRNKECDVSDAQMIDVFLDQMASNVVGKVNVMEDLKKIPKVKITTADNGGVIIDWKGGSRSKLEVPVSVLLAGMEDFQTLISSYKEIGQIETAKSLIEEVAKDGNDLFNALVKNEDIDVVLSLIDGNNIKLSDNRWSNLKRFIGRKTNTDMVTKMAKVSSTSIINSMVIKEQNPGNNQVPMNMPAPTKQGGSEKVNKEEALAMAAVGMAFPAAALFQSAINLMGSLKEMSRLAKKMNQIANAIAESYPKEVALINQLETANLSISILHHQNKIISARKQAARAQLAAANDMKSELSESLQEERRRITLKKSFMFFYIEMMRQEFDLLEQSLALWTHGDRSAYKNIIMRELKEDPDYLRLALDPDIGLYNWIDRSQERSRIDLIGIDDHWKRMQDIAQLVCDSHCDVDGQKIGEINKTKIMLSDLLDEQQLNDWRQWQREKGSGEKSFVIPILPSTQLGFHDDAYNVRIIALDAVGCNEGGQCDQNLNEFSIAHNGSAIIKTIKGNIVSEWLPPKTQSAFPNNMPDVQTLWQDFNDDLSLKLPLMGYGLFSPLVLTMEASDDNHELGDVEVQFAYYFRRMNEPVDFIQSQFGLYEEQADQNPLFEVVVIDENEQVLMTPQVMMGLGPLSGVNRFMRRWDIKLSDNDTTNIISNVNVADQPVFKIRPVCEAHLKERNAPNIESELTDEDVKYENSAHKNEAIDNADLRLGAIQGNKDRLAVWKKAQKQIIAKSKGVEFVANDQCDQYLSKEIAAGGAK